MTVTYRPARAQDLEEADRLVVASINDLTERHGFGKMAISRPPNFQAFSLANDPRGLWIAEEDDTMLGFAWSWTSGDLWFLAQLFVAPGRQGSGIGNALIKRTLDHAAASGATARALITFTFNAVSQGLYIRHGLFPRFPVYVFSVARERLKGRPAGAGLRAEALRGTASQYGELARVDISALGVSREQHHRYLMNDHATLGFGLYAGEACVGYAYIGLDGHVGPLAVTTPDALRPALATALYLAADLGTEQVSACLPGISAEALTTAVEHGMRIRFPMILMSNRDFGDWSRYLPRNPGFM